VDDEPRVEIGAGTAFEVLLGAAAVADDVWRDVFAGGSAVHAAVVAALGTDFAERVACLGRYGWINLAGLVVTRPAPWGLAALVTAVRDESASEVHYVVLGGHRRQVLDAVGEPVIRAATAGEESARSMLRGAFDSDELAIDTTPWLLQTRSDDVRRLVLDVLRKWRRAMLPRAAELELITTLDAHVQAARTRLAGSGPRAFLDAAITNIHFESATLRPVLAVSSPQVRPIAIVVDGRDRTLILHPPVDGSPGPGGSERLLELTRAIGDKTRVRVLTALRGRELTAVELARELQAPRTTLLHHLAILRSAGLIAVTVTPGDATHYRLRPGGMRELATVAARFIPTA
jgi:DNA-binding transcriptional ArsR family regulator